MTLTLPRGLDLSDFTFCPRSERALRMVKPETLEEYVLARGYRAYRADEKVVYYENDSVAGRWSHVTMLRRTDLLDYCQRMHEALKELAEAEDRTEFEVFCELVGER